MKISKLIIALALGISSFAINAQSNTTLKSQLAFCKQESAQLDLNLTKYKDLLEIQGEQIKELKIKVQDQEIEIKNLKYENEHLQTVAIGLLDLGIAYEEEGNSKAAVEIYRLLIKSYPTTLEAVASKLKIIDINKKKKLESQKK